MYLRISVDYIEQNIISFLSIIAEVTYVSNFRLSYSYSPLPVIEKKTLLTYKLPLV